MSSAAPTLQLEPLLADAAIAHGHLCAGQVLGVRMAMHACALLGVTDPRGAERKRLVTFVEIDRCATDAIGVVTGCRLGKRALKFVDFGKMAATFVDLTRPIGNDAYAGIRIAARESSKELARQRFPAIADKEPAADDRLPRTYGRRTFHRAMGRRPAPAKRVSRLQGAAHYLRALRRRSELPARGHPRRTHTLPKLCTPGEALLPSVVHTGLRSPHAERPVHTHRPLFIHLSNLYRRYPPWNPPP